MVTTEEAGNAAGSGTDEPGVVPVPVPVPVPVLVFVPEPVPVDVLSPPAGVVPAPAGVVPVPADGVPDDAVSAVELPPPPPQAPKIPAAIIAAMSGRMAVRLFVMRSSPAGKALRRTAHAGK